jgi:hypothetical protein
LSRFRWNEDGTRRAFRRNRVILAHHLVHLVMAGVMGASMVGAHSPARVLVAAAALLMLAMALARAARRSALMRTHVLDCFAMALAMLAMLADGPVDAATPVHGHGALIAAPGLTALALVAAGWAAARLALLFAARTGRRASLVGATLTAAGLALMSAMG